MKEVRVRATVNGRPIDRLVKARQNLADFLREELELTGTHVGCEHGVCGACTVVVDDEIVRSCLCLAAQIDGRNAETIEGLSDRGALSDLQAAFLGHNAAQCGYCTPGMLISARELLRSNPCPSREDVREFLSGNFCRCTGYQAIVDAVLSAASSVRAQGARS